MLHTHSQYLLIYRVTYWHTIIAYLSCYILTHNTYLFIVLPTGTQYLLIYHVTYSLTIRTYLSCHLLTHNTYLFIMLHTHSQYLLIYHVTYSLTILTYLSCYILTHNAYLFIMLSPVLSGLSLLYEDRLSFSIARFPWSSYRHSSSKNQIFLL